IGLFICAGDAKHDRQQIVGAGEFGERERNVVTSMEPQIEAEDGLVGRYRARKIVAWITRLKNRQVAVKDVDNAGRARGRHDGLRETRAGKWAANKEAQQQPRREKAKTKGGAQRHFVHPLDCSILHLVLRRFANEPSGAVPQPLRASTW